MSDRAQHSHSVEEAQRLLGLLSAEAEQSYDCVEPTDDLSADEPTSTSDTDPATEEDAAEGKELLFKKTGRRWSRRSTHNTTLNYDHRNILKAESPRVNLVSPENEDIYIDKDAGYVYTLSDNEVRQRWQMPRDIVEYMNSGKVERWRREQDKKTKKVIDRLIANDGAYWWEQVPMWEGDAPDTVRGVPIRLPDVSKITPEAIPVGKPGYWLHITEGDLKGEAFPVYGYMLDMGRRSTLAPLNDNWHTADWDTAEWLQRCCCCGRELPPIAYNYENLHMPTVMCGDCIRAALWFERLDSLPVTRRTTEQQQLLDDYRTLVRVWYERGLCPRGAIAEQEIGADLLRVRMYKARFVHIVAHPRGYVTRPAFETRQSYIADQKATIKSRTDINSLFTRE